jgi:SAM-dependent methyltransferase
MSSPARVPHPPPMPSRSKSYQMSESLVYRSVALYELVMLALYGRHYAGRFRAIAELIPDGSSVLDVCCGPGNLYSRHLKRKSISYLGIDLNPRFVAHVRRQGGSAEIRDLCDDQPLPPADYVIMQASLYHFLPDPRPLVDRMIRAARQQVIIAEPIRNLSQSSIPWLAALARRQTDAGSGAQPNRFDQQSLDAFFAKYQGRISRTFLLPGGREKLYVLNASSEMD